MNKRILLLAAFMTACPLTACSPPSASGTVSSAPSASLTVEEGAEGITEGTADTAASQDSTALKAQDLDLFCSTLEARHKNMYAHISKADFESEREKIEAGLPDMSDSDYYYSLRHLASLIGDSHTSLDFNKDKYTYLHGLPFAIQKFSDGWHLAMLSEENQNYLGCRLLSINNIPIEEVFERAQSIISSDNRIWSEVQFSNTINFAEALEYLGITEKGGDIFLNIQKPSGGSDTITLKMPAMTEAEIMSAHILSLTPLSTPETSPHGIYRAQPLGKDCYYIQYNECKEAPDLSMDIFASRIGSDIRSLGTSKIILDLRYNSGGNSEIIKPLFNELDSLKKDMGIKVYTLIGSNTFSSAVINAVQSKKLLDSTLVGSPTGGSVNSYGEIKSFNLTYEPITIYYSTKYFELIKGYEHDSLYPDIEVASDYHDYYNGIDRAVESVLAMP